jgi:sRNA-binding carbon storage regulator CsrA
MAASKILLSDFCREHGQGRAAEILGVTQGSVSLMIKAGRKIYIVRDESGEFYGEEIRIHKPVRAA